MWCASHVSHACVSRLTLFVIHVCACDCIINARVCVQRNVNGSAKGIDADNSNGALTEQRLNMDLPLVTLRGYVFH